MHILSSQPRGLGFRIEEYQTCILWPIFLANNAVAENNQNVHILWHLIPVEELKIYRFWMAYKGVTQNPSSKSILGRQPNSFLILFEFIEYLKSCPGHSHILRFCCKIWHIALTVWVRAKCPADLNMSSCIPAPAADLPNAKAKDGPMLGQS